jgi:integral membrane protein
LLASPVGRFRVIAFIEGVSFLVLLFIAMPIKYVPALGGDPMPTRIVGSVHGVLFILFALAGFLAMHARKWPKREVLRGFLASVLPGGTFVYDWAFLRGEYEAEQATTINKASRD